ncbi:ATP-dependent Clp protease proteolytic subunit [Marinilabilia salmonicolor]|uniref:ATP-dependent Clp protease proteolytic subunit n=1 Tax=Marinilabilia salmonicolor TaxID=989 RepID=UPI00029A94EF|nr:ATP-dependent Clp protease proteolytic subunit [Marinilabilia salmonicolor]
MSKPKLQINVFAEDTTARVDIIGEISEWNNNNATDFRAKCQELKDAGATKCHVYLMTVGGDCIQANEIVNILHEVFGEYTGDGGAIVASAGTYIAACATVFEQVRNGQFMIHKPMGGTFGNETEIENYLALVKNMTSTYYDAYAAKLKKPESEFKDKWNGGDFWMTAQQAVEWGFVTKVKDSVKIDTDTAAVIKESGSPIAIANTDIIHNNNLEMDVKAIATTLGMPEKSTEQEVNARIADNAKKAADYDALKAETERKEKEQREADIKATLDKAEKEKRIKADARSKWQAMFDKDYDGTKALLDDIQPVEKPLSSEIKTSADGKTATYNGKNFEQLQDEDPELLAQLEDENPTAFDALFADWKKRNKIK